MKLWDKGYKLDQVVEVFMTGDDPTLDHALIAFDCLGSIAHARMLAKIGILTAAECQQLSTALHGLIQQAADGTFAIRFEDEDVHTAVENALVAKLGEVGKKLHTARSRNDQVLVDLRLYMRDWILKITQQVLSVGEVLCDFAHQYREVPIPGRTHFQRAMPSSLGLWAGAFAESLLDDVELLKCAYRLVDQCPLGSAASYGASLPLDRQLTSDLLGFEKVQNNVLYANNSRGKFEAVCLNALVQIMSDLSKIATDIIIFCTPEFGYVRLPEKFCPGSSLMPQKRNPCPLELIRGKSAAVQAALFQVLDIVRGLPSGYNRDFQETKRPLMQGFEITLASLEVFEQVFVGLQVDAQRCVDSFSSELFATDAVLDLVLSGMPFRDAYKAVGLRPEATEMRDPIANIQEKTHLGATGNLGLELSRRKLKADHAWVEERHKRWAHTVQELLKGV